MGRNLFLHLPSEIIINILSRLPVRSIAISKCVCKPWLDLLETDDFIKSHLSKSSPALALMLTEMDSNPLELFELEGELNLESRGRLYSSITKFDVKGARLPSINNAANGLLLLDLTKDLVRVCNPITREYLDLAGPYEYGSHGYYPTYGIGVSKVTGQYKVLRIDEEPYRCHVYTLGTGSWRRIQTDVLFSGELCAISALVNGNLHWNARISPTTSLICYCFDVEAECFSTFSVPTPLGNQGFGNLSVLRDCLCFCDNSCDGGGEIVIWLMKEYGVEKSWSKEYVITGCDGIGYRSVIPIRVFKSGDILIVWKQHLLLYYSNNSKTTQIIGSFVSQVDCFVSSRLLSPSFVSLKSLSLGKEDVISF